MRLPLTYLRAGLFSFLISKMNRFRVAAFIVITTFCALSLALFHSGAQERESLVSKTKQPGILNVDIRANNNPDLTQTLEKRSEKGVDLVADITGLARAHGNDIATALFRMRLTDPRTEITISPLTGAVEVLKSAHTLTGPKVGYDGETIARDFITANKKLYGLEDFDIANLHFVGESVNEFSGLRLVILEQVVNGRPVFQGDCKVSIDRDGRIIQTLSNLAPYA